MPNSDVRWLTENVSTPPADVLVMPDGALLVSDDAADTIYRISYNGGGQQSASSNSQKREDPSMRIANR